VKILERVGLAGDALGLILAEVLVTVPGTTLGAALDAIIIRIHSNPAGCAYFLGHHFTSFSKFI
jgi:hypothetical protein